VKKTAIKKAKVFHYIFYSTFYLMWLPNKEENDVLESEKEKKVVKEV
jgi:hypothetical protein